MPDVERFFIVTDEGVASKYINEITDIIESTSW